jgi:predicted  nucleic acid-binding Zn-ribbon protein
MTRQYKSRFEELLAKLNDLEREKEDNKSKIESLDEALNALEEEHKAIEKEKFEYITALRKQIDDMSQEFALMLKSTLDKMGERIKEANRQWEEDNDSGVLKHFDNT